MRDPLRFESCLVDGDPVRQRMSRKNRTVSVILSTGLQVVFLGALLAAPLLLTAEGPLQTHFVTPVPPYGPKSDVKPQKGSDPPKGPSRPTPVGLKDVVFQPPRVPDRIVFGDGEEVPRIGSVGDGRVPVDGGGGTSLIPIPGDGRPAWTPPEPPRPEPPPQQRIVVSTGVQEARLIQRAQPVYPEIPRRARLETTVELRAVIGRDGTIQELEVLSGNPLFYNETLRAVQQWRYRPTLLNGVPVEVETKITVVYKLRL